MYSPSEAKPHSKKSLTPQRKHRKLLKDGSGEEVWPESVEKIFVQGTTTRRSVFIHFNVPLGLREYWQSPWATYTQSRGRSRWRNQFLVDYLQNAAINRTKKQVASHIQVLRNMWKGEPGQCPYVTVFIYPHHSKIEFYLVAGGEELLLETGMSGLVKVEDGADMPLDSDEVDSPSSHSASPDYSPCGRLSADIPSPTASLPIDSGASSALLHNDDPTSYPFHANIRPSQSHESFRSAESPLVNSSPSAFPGPAIPLIRGLYKHGSLLSSSPRTSDISPQTSGPNRIKTFCLLADGMTPFSINVDALASQPRRTWLALKIKLCITSVDDICSPSTLHGFASSIHLSDAWITSGKCITKVYVGNVCISEEVGTLAISSMEVGRVTAVLPDSSLTRCRWLDACGYKSFSFRTVVC